MGAKLIKVCYDILSPSAIPCFDALSEHGFKKVMRFNPDGSWEPYTAPRYMAKMVHVADKAGCIRYLRTAAGALRSAADPKPGECLIFEWKLPGPPGCPTVLEMLARLKLKSPKRLSTLTEADLFDGLPPKSDPDGPAEVGVGYFVGQSPVAGLTGPDIPGPGWPRWVSVGA